MGGGGVSGSGGDLGGHGKWDASPTCRFTSSATSANASVHRMADDKRWRARGLQGRWWDALSGHLSPRLLYDRFASSTRR
eukprot:6495074-Prymnesium_polylepis.1